jgi:hypothetical protein
MTESSECTLFEVVHDRKQSNARYKVQTTEEAPECITRSLPLVHKTNFGEESCETYFLYSIR